MKLSDIKQIRVTDLKLEGNEIIEATVENVYATEVLQAEGRAEIFLYAEAERNGQTVKADRWHELKTGDGMAETWSIRFYTKR